jgi:lariat debranching enzyme
MDRLSIISGALFFTADVFAVASLAMPRWIVSDIGGNKNKTTKTK